MNDKYTIIADGVTLDTNDDISISLNYQIDDILDISSRPTNWTRSITLPSSGTNNKFFKHIFDVNVDNTTFNPLKKIPVIVRAGADDIFRGNMQLEKISEFQGKISYDVSIYGILNNVMSDIKDLLMSELDLSEFNHVRNQTNIINSHDYKVVQNGSVVDVQEPGVGYVYPYIIYGQDTNFASNTNIYDAFPSVYSTQLFKRVINNQGYAIKSDFLDTEYAKRLIIPFSNEKLMMSEEVINAFGAVIGIVPSRIDATSMLNRGSNWQMINNLPGWTRESGTVDDQSGEITFRDSLNQYSLGFTINGGGGTWTTQNQGYYNVGFRATAYGKYTHDDGEDVNYNEGTGEFEYIYRMWKINASNGQHQLLTQSDGGTILFTPGGGEHASPWVDTAVPLNMSLQCDNLLLAPGDQIFIEYGFRYPSGVKWNSDGGNDKVKAQLVFDRSLGNEFSYLSITPTSNVDMGNQMLDMNQILPVGWKQTNFIEDYIKMFNLVVTEDPENERTLIIEPRDVYYSTNNEILPWDTKWDEESGVEITPMSEVDANEYAFTYSADSDYYNVQYTESFKSIYGDYKINVGNDFSDKTSSTKLTFCPTPDSSKFSHGKVAPYLVKMDDEKFKPFKAKPRILFYGGKIPTGYFIYQDYPGQTSGFTVLNYYPYAGMWDHPFEPTHDLGFGPTSTIYWDSYQYPVKNLFNEFHKNTVNNIINPNARLLKAKFNLTTADIAQFDFRNVVYFQGSYWRVNEIKNYDPTSAKLTVVVLYKILDAYTVDKVTAQLPPTAALCPIDMITRRIGKKFVHVSKSGEHVSQACCDSLGGNYKNGVCYIGDYSVDPVVSFASANIKTPAPSPEGPQSETLNGNTVVSNGVKVTGRNNVVNPEVDPTVMMIGDGNTALSGAKNQLIIGDNQTTGEPNTINLNGTIISENGSITVNFNMVRGGKNTVRPLFPYNTYWNMIKSGKNAIRDIDFESQINMIQGGRNSV